jgi:hypothetical protein
MDCHRSNVGRACTNLPSGARSSAFRSRRDRFEKAVAMSVESKGTPARERGVADHDEPYTWHLAPTTYLAPRQIARMMVLRSRLDDRHMLRHRDSRLPLRTEADR